MGAAIRIMTLLKSISKPLYLPSLSNLQGMENSNSNRLGQKKKKKKMCIGFDHGRHQPSLRLRGSHIIFSRLNLSSFLASISLCIVSISGKNPGRSRLDFHKTQVNENEKKTLILR